MPKKNAAEPQAAEDTVPRFVSITAGGDGELYALTESGAVYQYLEDGSNNGWFQLDHDGVRIGTEIENDDE